MPAIAVKWRERIAAASRTTAAVECLKVSRAEAIRSDEAPNKPASATEANTNSGDHVICPESSSASIPVKCIAAIPLPITAPPTVADRAPPRRAALRPTLVTVMERTRDKIVKPGSYAASTSDWYASIAIKWVAQIPHPPAAAHKPSQIKRSRPPVACARWNRLIVTLLASTHITNASATRRLSCSTVRQVMTRNIVDHSNGCPHL
jgi:hypothetical protein